MISGSALVLGMVISTLYGALFHFLRGGGLGRLALYIFLAWVGFWSGHFLGLLVNWPIFMVGSLALGSGTLGSLIVLFAGNWLSLIEPPEEP